MENFSINLMDGYVHTKRREGTLQMNHVSNASFTMQMWKELVEEP